MPCLRQRTAQITPGALGLVSRAGVLRSAMGGTVLFEDALEGRLDLMRPSRATVAAFLAAHPPRLTRGPWPSVARAQPLATSRDCVRAASRCGAICSGELSILIKRGCLGQAFQSWWHGCRRAGQTSSWYRAAFARSLTPLLTFWAYRSIMCTPTPSSSRSAAWHPISRMHTPCAASCISPCVLADAPSHGSSKQSLPCKHPCRVHLTCSRAAHCSYVVN